MDLPDENPGNPLSRGRDADSRRLYKPDGISDHPRRRENAEKLRRLRCLHFEGSGVMMKAWEFKSPFATFQMR